jgi:uncharacterized protein YjbI with pentapeptide repeats
MQDGCDWKGKQLDLLSHETVCEFELVRCPSRCQEMIVRSALEFHKSQCQVLINLRNEEQQAEREAKQQRRAQENEEKQKQIAQRETKRRKAQERMKKKITQRTRPPAQDVVRLNVGGTSFLTSKLSLIQEGGSTFFASLFDEEANWEDEYFIDRNPEAFSMVLDFLRYGTAFAPQLASKPLHLLLAEGLFWCLPGLVEEIVRFLCSSGQSLEVSGLHLAARDFSAWNFSQLSFVGCSFEASSFDGSDLSGCRFSQCQLGGCSFRGALFGNEELRATFVDCSFDGADLPQVSFATFVNTRFDQTALPLALDSVVMKQVDLSGHSFVSLRASDFFGSSFSDATLQGDLSHSSFADCDLSGTKFRSAVFCETVLPLDLTGCCFLKCDLEAISLELHSISEVDFRGSVLGKLPRTVSGCHLRDCSFVCGVQSVFDACDFRGAETSQISFSSVSFLGCSLDGLRLPLQVMESSFREADLTGVDLVGRSFVSCDLQRTVFPQELSSLAFQQSDLAHCDFRQSDLSSVVFTKCSLKGVQFPQNLDHVEFLDCDLSHFDFSEMSLAAANFAKSRLVGTKLPKTLRKCNFSHCELSHRDFSGAELSGANFSGANLSAACFSGAALLGANFSRSKLDATTLPKILWECNFSHCDLSSRDFSKAELAGVDFEGANLIGANFIATNLFEAKLCNSVMANINVSKETRFDGVRANTFADSVLLSGAQQMLLGLWAGNPGHKWKRIYCASIDGDSASAFHRCCDQQGVTLTVVQSGTNLFGGFATARWTSFGNYKRAEGCFLFTLVNPHGLRPTKFLCDPNRQTNAMFDHSHYGATFGGAGDLSIWDQCLKNSSSACNFPHTFVDTCGHGNSTFTGSKNFQVSEIEVFTPK